MRRKDKVDGNSGRRQHWFRGVAYEDSFEKVVAVGEGSVGAQEWTTPDLYYAVLDGKGYRRN